MPDPKVDWTGRMDNMESRQDLRHHENVLALQKINDKLDPLIIHIRQVVGDENYRGRMGLAEDNIAKLDEAVAGIKTTIAKWSGGMVVGFAVIEFISKLLEKWKP